MDYLSPFGQPDGSFGNFTDRYGEVVALPDRFGGIGRDPHDATVRVVVGPMGTGKTLTLRRMADVQKGQGASYATAIQGGGDLTTESVARFAKKTSNTEEWTRMWRRAIICSAYSYLITELADHVDTSVKQKLDQYSDLLGNPGAPHPAPQIVNEVIRTHWNAGPDLVKYLSNALWVEVEYWIAEALRDCPTIFIYLDDIDKNYAWAPSLWTQCQRGLFYEVMDLLRRDIFRNKLHVVIAIRDVTLASIRLSEYALRYRDEHHINTLRWDRDSIKLFLQEKVRLLPKEYLNGGSPTVQAWLRVDQIHADRPGRPAEDVSEYIIRHTRLAPRDLVIMGNALCRRQREAGHPLSEEEIRKVVGEVSAELGENLLVICSNQIMSDLLPGDAVDKEYDHVFLKPNKYAIADVRLKLLECISSTQREGVSLDVIESMDEVSTHLFREVCPTDVTIAVSDVFWQHRLLGIIEAGTANATFFNPEHFFGRPILPRPEGAEYVWNPLVFDLGAKIEPTLAKPLFPGGR